MNITERAAHIWLMEEGYAEEDIRFRSHTSPDFITADGKGWEVKLARNGSVLFYKAQVESIRAADNVTVLIWGDRGGPLEVVPFGDLEVPGTWKHYRFTVPDPGRRLTITMTDEEYEALRVAAFHERKSLSALAVARIFKRATATIIEDGAPAIPQDGADRAELFKRRTQ